MSTMAAEKHHGEMFHLVHASGQELWSKAAERKLKTRQTLDSTSKGSWDLVTKTNNTTIYLLAPSRALILVVAKSHDPPSRPIGPKTRKFQRPYKGLGLGLRSIDPVQVWLPASWHSS